MSTTTISDEWARQIYSNELTDLNESLTFCGALEHRYNHIAYYWNQETRRKHEQEYNNIILPALKNHNEKTIREYSKEDFDEAIETIKSNGYWGHEGKKQYSESSIRNFERLIYTVVFHASRYKLCDNVLWGTKFMIESTEEEEEYESRIILKKSLSIQQEKALYRELLSDIEEDGSMVALLLMWGLGLRNAEACGLNYGDIRPLDGHEECKVAWIYKTTKIYSNELQTSGKTYNTGRIIPVPSAITTFLKKRRLMVAQMLDSLHIDMSIDDLPICCKGRLEKNSSDFLIRCTAKMVTLSANRIFEGIGVSAKQLAYLDDLLDQGDTAAVLKEKEPTAYLLRRNFATQMSVLGLTVPEMQYLIGHDVEDIFESRNEYVDSDRIYEMAKKLRHRELLNTEIPNEDFSCIVSNYKPSKIHLSAEEPEDEIRIVVSVNKKTIIPNITCYEEAVSPTYSRTVDILKLYHEKYKS